MRTKQNCKLVAFGLTFHVLVTFSTSEAFAQGTPWHRHVIDDSFRGADGVRLADANGDGLSDIVTGYEESGQTRAFFHPGVSSVTERWPAVTVGDSPSVEDAVWVDLNGDGQLDVLSSCEGKEQALRVHLSRTNQRLLDPKTWESRSVPVSRGMTRWMFATPFPRQINQQPIVPIAVGSKAPNGMVGALTFDIKKKSWTIHKLTDAQWIMSLFVTDFDQDGDQDILYSDRKGKSSGVFWLENVSDPGTPTTARFASDNWQRHLIGAYGKEVMFLTMNTQTDASDEQQPDIEIFAAVKPNLIYRLYSADDITSLWTEEIIEVAPVASFGTAKGIACADVDGDQHPDLVYTCEHATPPKSGVVLLTKDTTSGWTAHDIGGPDGTKFDLVELVDLDRDGDLDVLTCEERHDRRGLGIIWYENPLH